MAKSIHLHPKVIVTVVKESLVLVHLDTAVSYTFPKSFAPWFEQLSVDRDENSVIDSLRVSSESALRFLEKLKSEKVLVWEQTGQASTMDRLHFQGDLDSAMEISALNAPSATDWRAGIVIGGFTLSVGHAVLDP